MKGPISGGYENPIINGQWEMVCEDEGMDQRIGAPRTAGRPPFVALHAVLDWENRSKSKQQELGVLLVTSIAGRAKFPAHVSNNQLTVFQILSLSLLFHSFLCVGSPSCAAISRPTSSALQWTFLVTLVETSLTSPQSAHFSASSTIPRIPSSTMINILSPL